MSEVAVTHCPTAYADGAHTQQGQPVSVSDRVQLRLYDRRNNWRSEQASERMRRVKPWEKSSRNRKPREIPI